MYTPPPKKSKTGLIIGLVVLAVLVCCGGPILFAVGGSYFVLKKGQGFLMCQASLESIQKAAKEYTAEKGHLPTAANWESEIRPYYKAAIKEMSEGQNIIKTIPVEGPIGCAEESGTTGFAINLEVAGKKLDAVKDKSVPLLFEVPKAGKNLAQPYKPSPFDQSPGMMGMSEKRGWYIVPIDGDPYLLGESGRKTPARSGRSGISIDTKSSD
ncbi:hypothetical protein EON81_20475 [bacterium]|nr:MAG: hypothetical protein EON81_20475 [bacterium]